MDESFAKKLYLAACLGVAIVRASIRPGLFGTDTGICCHPHWPSPAKHSAIRVSLTAKHSKSFKSMRLSIMRNRDSAGISFV